MRILNPIEIKWHHCLIQLTEFVNHHIGRDITENKSKTTTTIATTTPLKTKKNCSQNPQITIDKLSKVLGGFLLIILINILDLYIPPHYHLGDTTTGPMGPNTNWGRDKQKRINNSNNNSRRENTSNGQQRHRQGDEQPGRVYLLNQTCYGTSLGFVKYSPTRLLSILQSLSATASDGDNFF